MRFNHLAVAPAQLSGGQNKLDIQIQHTFLVSIVYHMSNTRVYIGRNKFRKKVVVDRHKFLDRAQIFGPSQILHKIARLAAAHSDANRI